MEEGQYFSGFLWAPSKQYWNKIIRDISSKYQIIHTKKYKFNSSHDLENMIIWLYKNDHVSMTQVRTNKIETLMKYPPICLHFEFYVNKPEIKGLGVYAVEPNVIKMKNAIRKKYRKYIENHDRYVIIHISDNIIQTSFIDDIINKAIVHKRK